jgi:hypothetical protein
LRHVIKKMSPMALNDQGTQIMDSMTDQNSGNARCILCLLVAGAEMLCKLHTVA